MRIATFTKAVLILGVVATACFARNASAEVTECMEITSVPATISTQGVYCLKKHHGVNLASGSAVTVTVNNVTIDCNEFKLGNLQNGPATQAVGIYANGRINLTVRNCGIRGWRHGVLLTNGDYQVEDNRFDQNNQSAISVTGDGSAVRRNEVVDTGGSTLAGITQFHAISVAGTVDVVDNNVTGVMATNGSGGTVYGIYIADAYAAITRGNRVRSLVADGSGARRGIWVQSGNRNSMEGNTVVMDGNLVIGEAGIRCGDGLVLGGASRDNTVLGTGVLGTSFGLVNCTSVEGNYVNPL